MAKFRKIICRPSVYRVNTAQGRQIKPITRSLLESVAKTTNEMIAAGLKIPAPFAHRDGNKVVPSPLVQKDGQEVDAESMQPKIWSSDLNAGFWDRVSIDKSGNLVGEVDVPNDTDAEKVGKTIQETSVFIEPEFTDGLGRTWKNALRHVALVNNAVEPDQPNFEPISEDYALAMAFSMADEVGGSSYKPEEKDTTDNSGEDTTKDAPTDSANEDESSCTANISEIVSLLRDKLGYEMPADTDEKNFLDRLRTILVSIKEDPEPDEELKDLDKKPKDAETESAQIAMANEDTNPDNVVFINKINKLVAKQLADLKEEFKNRITALIKSGKITKKYAEAELFPSVGSIQMSHEDLDAEGNLPKHWLEMSLSALEERPGLTDSAELLNELDGSTEPDPEDIPQMSEAEAESIYKSVL